MILVNGKQQFSLQLKEFGGVLLYQLYRQRKRLIYRNNKP